MMRVTLAADGKVRHAAIAKSSGFADLDAAAQAWIERADPLPGFPSGLTAEQIELVVPLRFVLR